jgi:hypothetical protein
MDEFFDFENAIQPVDHLEDPMTGPCDIDLAFAELPQAEDPITQFNQFEDPVPKTNSILHFMMLFTIYPSWALPRQSKMVAP